MKSLTEITTWSSFTAPHDTVRASEPMNGNTFVVARVIPPGKSKKEDHPDDLQHIRHLHRSRSRPRPRRRRPCDGGSRRTESPRGVGRAWPRGLDARHHPYGHAAAGLLGVRFL